MPVKITPLEQTFNLFSDEPGDDTIVTIRQATRGDMDKRDSYALAEKRTLQEGSVIIESKWTLSDQERLEAYLTLVECNIQTMDGPLFRFSNGRYDGNFEQFGEPWAKLPIDWAERIHTRVLQMNPQFDPNYKPASTKTSIPTT